MGENNWKGEVMLIFLVLIFLLLILLSFPISSILAFLSIFPEIVLSEFPTGAAYSIRGMIGGSDSFLLLAIPMFMLSGVIMTKGKISEKLFNIFAYYLGKYKAGLPCAAIITCLFYSAISGSAPATTAAVGSMLIPLLVDLGYDKSLVTALIATSGGLGVIIPPSIPFILYGNATDTGVANMFKAGIIPGFLIAMVLILITIIQLKFDKNTDDGQRIQFQIHLREEGFLKLLKEGIWALLAPVIVLGSIYSGFASPTESAVISVFYALFVSGFVYKSVRVKDLKIIFLDTIRIYAPILFLLAAAIAFSRTLTILQVPQQVVSWVEMNLYSQVLILLFIHLFLFIVGMVMDTGASILILGPILVPVVESVGINPVHFGIMMVINLAIGFVTPPVGVNLYVASGISGLNIQIIAKKTVPYVFGFMIALIILICVPQLCLL